MADPEPGPLRARDGTERDPALIERDRRRRRRSALQLGGVALLIAAVVAWAVIDGPLRLRRRGPTVVVSGAEPLGPDGAGIDGALDGRFSPDGATILVRMNGGRLGIARGGKLEPIVPAATQVAAYAWLTSQTVLMQEGPSDTGQLVALRSDGTVAGRLALRGELQPGGSLAVAPDGRSAVIATATRRGIDGTQEVDLATVGLKGGVVRRITSTPLIVETAVAYVDAATLAVTLRSPGQATSAALIDVTTGESRPLPGAGEGSVVIGVAAGRVFFARDDGLFSTVASGDPVPRRVRSVPAQASVVAVSPDGARALYRETVDASGTTRLRLVALS